MIDFSKIAKTVDGLDCYYIGQRTSGGKTIHRFAIANDASEVICYYDEQGKRLEFSGAGGWVVCKTGIHQIIAPPKIVEVTKWIGLSDGGNGNYSITFASSEDGFGSGFVAKQQHTFRFEVPNE